MRIFIILLALGFLVSCASAPSGPSSQSVALAGINSCKQQQFKTNVENALCQKSAVEFAYRGTFASPYMNWLAAENVALSEQLDAGKITDAQAQAHLNADYIQVNQQMMAQMSQMAASQISAERPLYDSIARGIPQPVPSINCTGNTYSGTTYTHCQ